MDVFDTEEANAFERSTGLQWDYDRDPPVSFETGSNPDGGW